ncbi:MULTISPECIES: bifunctional DNA primase/polymerase [unclassified Bradyrhizobium]
MTAEAGTSTDGMTTAGALERLSRRLTALSIDVSDEVETSVDLVSSPGASVFGAMATRIVANGWSIYPQLALGNRMPGKVDGETIRPMNDHDLQNRLPTPGFLKKCIEQCRNHNIALVCGPASSDCMVMDIDILDPAWNAKITALALKILGPTPFRRVGKAPKIALFYRWSELPDGETPPASRSWRFDDGDQQSADGLELLSRGKVATIFGKHHTTGRDFRWHGPSPFDSRSDELPIVTPDQVKELIEEVGKVRPFYKGHAGLAATDVDWSLDPESDIVVPRPRRARDGTVPWTEDAQGKVVDGREAYLTHLVMMSVRHNPQAVGTEKGVASLKRIILDAFRGAAEISGRWVGGNLEREVSTKVNQLVRKARDGNFVLAPPPRRDASGNFLTEVERPVARVLPEGKIDTLSFIPRPDPTAALRYAGRRRLKIYEHPIGTSEAEVERRRNARAVVTDRSKEGKRTSETIDKAVGAFLEDIYRPIDERRNVVHLLKTPTGSGKTSRTFRTIALDPRTKEDYVMEGKDGLETGRFPFLFLLPTYANIGELRARAEVLNLDPSLSDEKFESAAREAGLVPADNVDAKIKELRREAMAAGLKAMIYKGKIQAGCKMADKLTLAMSAGISTSGFCRAEVRQKDAAPGQEKDIRYCPYHPDVNMEEPCPAILQRREIQTMHVVFLPHAFMSLTLPEELHKVRAVIADERIHDLFLHAARFKLNTFDRARPPPKLSKKERESGLTPEEVAFDRQWAAGIVKRALQEGKDPAHEIVQECRTEVAADAETEAFALAKIRVERAKRCCSGSWEISSLITPDIAMEELREICDTPAGVNIREEWRFWAIVLEGIEKAASGSLLRALQPESAPPVLEPTLDRRFQLLMPADPEQRPDPEVRMSWRTDPNWPDRPLLLLDASAAPEIVCKILKRKMEDLRLTPLETSMNIYTVAVIDRSYATSSLAPKTKDQEQKFKAAKLVTQVRGFLSLLSAAYGWSRVVAGTTMAIRRVINSGWVCPDNIDWVHFGALRGLDFAKFHAAAVSIGRLEPPLWVIDATVAALTYDDSDPELPFDRYGTERDEKGEPLRLPNVGTTVRMRSGHDYIIDVPGYPELSQAEIKAKGRDSWHRIVHKQYREEEQSQFLGRLRPVYREGETPVWFCVAKVIPEGVICDELVSLDDVMADARSAPNLWEAVRRGQGLLHPYIAYSPPEEDTRALTAPRGAADLYPDPGAVEADMRRAGLDPTTGRNTARYAWGFTPYRVERSDGDVSFAYARTDLEGDGRESELESAINWGLLCAGLAAKVTRVVRLSPIRPFDKTVRRKTPDKVDLELGDLTDRYLTEMNMTEDAAAAAIYGLELDRRQDGSIWFKGLREPSAHGSLLVPLMPAMNDKEWVKIKGKGATLAERSALLAVHRHQLVDAEAAAAPASAVVSGDQADHSGGHV